MTHEMDRVIGRNIRDIRKKQGLTQEELAARLQIYGLDMSRGVLSLVEIGMRHIYTDEIKAMKEVLKISYTDLFEES